MAAVQARPFGKCQPHRVPLCLYGLIDKLMIMTAWGTKYSRL